MSMLILWKFTCKGLPSLQHFMFRQKQRHLPSTCGKWIWVLGRRPQVKTRLYFTPPPIPLLQSLTHSYRPSLRCGESFVVCSYSLCSFTAHSPTHSLILSEQHSVCARSAQIVRSTSAIHILSRKTTRPRYLCVFMFKARRFSTRGLSLYFCHINNFFI